MAKMCPARGCPVLYLECQECEDRKICRETEFEKNRVHGSLENSQLQKRKTITKMENKSKLAEEKLTLIQKGFPKDPCKHCAFHDEGECGCDNRIDYQAALQRLHDLGIYDLMQDFQKINQNKSQIVWIQHEISRKNHQIATIQKRIDELEKKCTDAMEQLRKENGNKELRN